MNGSLPYAYPPRTTNDEKSPGTLSIPAAPSTVLKSTKQQLEHELSCKDQHCYPSWEILAIGAIFCDQEFFRYTEVIKIEISGITNQQIIPASFSDSERGDESKGVTDSVARRTRALYFGTALL